MYENRLYEFCFDKGITIRDSLTLTSFQYFNILDQPIPPETMIAFYKMAGRFCNFDPLELPFSEMENFTRQFTDALNKHLNPQGDE